MKVFVDTGANCNTISRIFYEILVAQGLKCVFRQLKNSTFIWLENRFYTLLVTDLSSRPKLEQVREIFFVTKIFWYNSVLSGSPTYLIKIVDTKI